MTSMLASESLLDTNAGMQSRIVIPTKPSKQLKAQQEVESTGLYDERESGDNFIETQ